MKDFIIQHRRVILLKLCVAVALAASHFYPDSGISLAVNLVWLFLF